jgi:antitoxin component YwqK of YwqJK toxin-antitoxin module
VTTPRAPSAGWRARGRALASALACCAGLAACEPGSPVNAPPDAPAKPAESASESGPPPEIAAFALQPGQSVDVIEAFHPDGRPLLRREVLRDADGLVNHGKFQRWHANGLLAEEGYYLNGQKHGLYLLVADTGLKESEIRYRLGVPDGPSTIWDELGQVRERAVYAGGQLDGPFETFVQGKPKEQGRYAHGLEDGPWTYWHPGAGKQAEGSYTAGRRSGVWRTWYVSGGLKREETYRDGVLDGPATELDEEGRKLAERSYAAGVPDGRQVEYYPDGRPQSEAHYSAGRLEGLQRRWFQDGALQVEGAMRGGKREGRWSYFHPDGTVNEEWTGEYRDDVRVSA